MKHDQRCLIDCAALDPIRLGGGIVLWALMTFFIHPAIAATIIVDETTCTLVDAIDAANADTPVGGCPAGMGADVIELTTNVTLTTVNNSDPDSGDNALPEVTSDISVKGGLFEILRDAGAPDFRFFEVAASGTLLLEDATLRAGSASAPHYFGGALVNIGTVTLRNSRVVGNSAEAAGAIANQGELILADSIVSGNSAGRAGGIENGGALTLTRSIVSGNSAGASGGGIINSLNATATLSNSTLSDNSAGFEGGGIFNSQFGTVTLTDSTVSGNSARNGGGISNIGILTLTRSSMSGNSANANGGGVFNYSGGNAWLTNSTVSGNSAGIDGGGLWISGYVSVLHSTVLGNSALQGGGIAGQGNGTTLVANSIVAQSPSGGACWGYITDNGNNFADDSTCGDAFGGITPGTDFDAILTNNGGPSETHALFLGSVAIDAAGLCELATDQRGLERNDGACDSGAVEFGGVAVVPPPVPDGTNAAAMRISRADTAGTAIDVTWNVGLCSSSGYHLIYGSLPDVADYSVSGSECGLGITGSAANVQVPLGDLWILVLANDGIQSEGSWGQAAGGERNGLVSSGECGFVVRDNGGACP